MSHETRELCAVDVSTIAASSIDVAAEAQTRCENNDEKSAKVHWYTKDDTEATLHEVDPEEI